MVVLLLPFFIISSTTLTKSTNEYHNQFQTQIHYLSRQLINTTEHERKLLAQNLYDGCENLNTPISIELSPRPNLPRHRKISPPSRN
jgi:signal transduction histidine kinase